MKTQRAYHLESTYDLTLEDFNEMMNKQNHTCAICHKKEDGKHLFVDHCHETGEVRGLLCRLCNFGIGHFKNDPDLTSSATRYLMKFQTRSVL